MDPCYRGKILAVYCRQGHDVVEIADACAILALRPSDDDLELLMVEQFRVAPNRTMWEIPAGRIDPGENPLQCAQRELAEESGYGAHDWTYLGGFYTAPGFSTEYLHVFAARGLFSHAKPVPGDECDISARWRSLATVNTPDAKTLAALHLWTNRVRGGTGRCDGGSNPPAVPGGLGSEEM